MTTRDGAGADARATDRDASTGPIAESGVRLDRVPTDASTLVAPRSSPPSPPSSVSPSSPPGAPSGIEETLHAAPSSPAGTPAMLAVGTVLDGVYLVEKPIGRGAMGAVYQVEHLRLGRKFAAKVVAPHHATNADVVQRLHNEARVASRLHHENVVDVTHLGQTPDGALFVVMELLEGRDLRDWIHDRRGAGPIAFADARWILADVMAGLAAAHDAGIVHRDLKPDNVFLVEKQGRQRAKIVDFGISKSSQTDEDLRLTRTGQIMGTPLYMAPEQARSTSAVDARADQYSLGVMMYELLTGRLPFEAANLYDIVVKHATETPRPLHAFRSDVPLAVEAVVLRCLAKKPDARFESIHAVREAWERAWDEPEIAITVEAPAPAPPSARPRWPIAVAIAAIAGAVVLGYVAMGGGSPRTSDVATHTRPVSPTPASSAEPPEVPDEPPVEPSIVASEPAPVVIRRTIHTTPEGAAVRAGDRELGVTPLEVELPADGSTLELELRLRGHRREILGVSSADPEPVTVELRRERTSSAPALAPR